jgi:hypothetical protein
MRCAACSSLSLHAHPLRAHASYPILLQRLDAVLYKSKLSRTPSLRFSIHRNDHPTTHFYHNIGRNPSLISIIYRPYTSGSTCCHSPLSRECKNIHSIHFNSWGLGLADSKQSRQQNPWASQIVAWWATTFSRALMARQKHSCHIRAIHIRNQKINKLSCHLRRLAEWLLAPSPCRAPSHLNAWPQPTNRL